MTIDEAIRRLEFDAKRHTSFLEYADYKALQLGTEALRRIQATRLVHKIGTVVLLPGETKDAK